LRSEEPVPSEAEGIWASRAMCRVLCDTITARLARFPIELHHYLTPAMEAGIADHVWSLEELVGLLEQKAQGAAA